MLPPALLTQRLEATLDLLQLPPEAGKGLVLRVPGVLLQPPGVTRSHVLGLSAVLNIPLVRSESTIVRPLLSLSAGAG